MSENDLIQDNADTSDYGLSEEEFWGVYDALAIDMAYCDCDCSSCDKYDSYHVQDDNEVDDDDFYHGYNEVDDSLSDEPYSEYEDDYGDCVTFERIIKTKQKNW